MNNILKSLFTGLIIIGIFLYVLISLDVGINKEIIGKQRGEDTNIFLESMNSMPIISVTPNFENKTIISKDSRLIGVFLSGTTEVYSAFAEDNSWCSINHIQYNNLEQGDILECNWGESETT